MMRLVRMNAITTDITKRDKILSVLDDENGDVVDGNNYRGWGKTTEILLKLLEDNNVVVLTTGNQIGMNNKIIDRLAEEHGYSNKEILNAKQRLFCYATNMRGIHPNILVLLDDATEAQYEYLKNRTCFRLRGFVNY